jgi:hypothetical protein
MIFLGWIAIIQIGFIIVVTIVGENYISEKGYYSYSPENQHFLGNVPIWIIPMWVFLIQSTALLAHYLGLGQIDIVIPPDIRYGGIVVSLFSGFTCFLLDFLIIEPYFSRRRGLWTWKSVENGYFRFISKEESNFTAPLGNYLVWFGFPIIANYIVVVLFALTH